MISAEFACGLFWRMEVCRRSAYEKLVRRICRILIISMKIFLRIIIGILLGILRGFLLRIILMIMIRIRLRILSRIIVWILLGIILGLGIVLRFVTLPQESHNPSGNGLYSLFFERR